MRRQMQIRLCLASSCDQECSQSCCFTRLATLQEEKRGRESARLRADLHVSHVNVQSAALGGLGGRVLNPLEMLELQDRQLQQHQEQQKAAAAAQQAQQAQVRVILLNCTTLC